MRQQRKPAKDPKSKLEAIRRFLGGEDLVLDLLELQPITQFVIIDSSDPEWKMNLEDFNKGIVYWPEKRTYSDPEIEGVRYQNKENVPVIESGGTVEAEIKVIPGREKLDHRAKYRARIEQLGEQSKRDLEHREAMNELNRANTLLAKQFFKYY